MIDISIHALLAESDNAGCNCRSGHRYFYPRSPCGERRQAQSLKIASLCISIHALLAESDCPWVLTGGLNYISIHALLAESDYDGLIASANFCKFLSTLSLRRATNSAYSALDGASISIHALLAESDETSSR